MTNVKAIKKIKKPTAKFNSSWLVANWLTKSQVELVEQSIAIE